MFAAAGITEVKLKTKTGTFNKRSAMAMPMVSAFIYNNRDFAAEWTKARAGKDVSDERGRKKRGFISTIQFVEGLVEVVSSVLRIPLTLFQFF